MIAPRRFWTSLLCGCLRIAPFNAHYNAGSYVGISLLNTTELHSAELFRIVSPVDLDAVDRDVNLMLAGTMSTLSSPLVVHLVGPVSSDSFIQLPASRVRPMLDNLQAMPYLRDDLVRLYGGFEDARLHDLYLSGACCRRPASARARPTRARSIHALRRARGLHRCPSGTPIGRSDPSFWSCNRASLHD
jgi:hypothetical protein